VYNLHDCINSWERKKKSCVIYYTAAKENLLETIEKGDKKQAETKGVCHYTPDRLLRDQWEYPRKRELHFPIKPGHPRGMALTISYSFSESPT